MDMKYLICSIVFISFSACFVAIQRYVDRKMREDDDLQLTDETSEHEEHN
jgi:hypothetical protein